MNAQPGATTRSVSLAALGAVAMLALVAIGSARPAAADFANGGFETGDLSGWTATGNVEVLQGSAFAPAFAAPAGDYFALLSSGPANTGGGDSGVNRDAGLGNEWDVATLTQTFDVAVDSTLAVRIAFGSSEDTLPGSSRDDIFQIRINGVDWVQGSVSGYVNSPWPDFGTPDAVDYTVTSAGATNGSRFADGMSAVTPFFLDLPAGSHTIEFFVGDEADYAYDSGLIVDDLSLTPLITLDPLAATLDAGQDRTVTATVTDSAGGMLADETVAFAVTDGPGRGTAGACAPNPDCTTDTNGQVSFTYTSEADGTDTIEACYDAPKDTHCAGATAEWLAAPADPAPTADDPAPPSDDATTAGQATDEPTEQAAAPSGFGSFGSGPSGGATAFLLTALLGGLLTATSAATLWLSRRGRAP
jgi:hypothetical protein